MGTPTPRKFSEKIALMERKQNEDQELFHSIMRDVKAITSNNSLSNPTTPLPCTQSSNQQSTNFLFHQNNNQGYSTNMMNNIYQQPSTTTDTLYQEIPITSNTLQLQNNGWNGVGGSLPNVHDPYFNQNQTVPQNTLNAFYINPNSNLNHHPSPTGSSYSSSHLRSRSPGAPNHYHPYSGGGTLSIIRSRPHYEKQNTFDGYEINYPGTSNQLVPPDMYPHKARSDSAINIHPHTNYHNEVIHNNNHYSNSYYNQNGTVQNYEQLNNMYNQNGLINNGNLIEDACNPNVIPPYNNYLSSTNSSRQQSPIPQQQTTQPPTNFCTNFQYDNSSNSPIHSPQYPPTSTYSGVSSPVCYTPSLGSPNSISQDSPINNIYQPSTNIIQQSTSEYPLQQSSTTYGNGILNNQQQSPIQVMNIPTTTTPPPQKTSCQQPPIIINQNGSFHQSCQQKQQQSSIVTYPQSQQTTTYPQQNLIGPYSTMSQESYQQQSSPESPSTSTTTYDKSSSPPRGCGYQINNKKYSNSPDPLDIPNIVLTGADGELDSFQNLNLTNDSYEYSPIISTSNGIISCSNGLVMTTNQQEMLITTGTEISSTYHNNINSSMMDHHSPIVIKRDFIN